MTARFVPSLYPGGRLTLKSGEVIVGAVFPPANTGGDYRWTLWKAHTTISQEGKAKTELAAMNALLAAWRDSLARMGLQEIET